MASDWLDWLDWLRKCGLGTNWSAAIGWVRLIALPPLFFRVSALVTGCAVLSFHRGV